MADYSPASEDDVRQASAKVKTADDQLASDWKAMMHCCEFRNILWSILEDAGIYRTSFTGNSETFFREGMRNLGLKIQARAIEADAAAFQLMWAEQLKRKTPDV
jgi:hypothetical protein